MAHLVQLHHLGPSLAGTHILRTNAGSGVPEYYPPGANGQVFTTVAGVAQWNTITFPSEFDAYPNQGAFPGVGNVDVIYYSSADNAFFIWDGAVYVEVPTAVSFSWTLNGQAGPPQLINNTDNVSIQGSNGFTTVTSATDTLTVTPPLGTVTGQVMTWNNGTTTWSAQAPPALTVAASAGTNPSIVIGTDTLSILAGLGISTTGNAGADSVTIALNAGINDLTDVVITAAAATEILAFDGTNWVDTNGCTWLGNFSINCLSDVDTTGAGVGDYLAWDGTNYVPTTPGGGFTSWTLAGDLGPNQTIGDSNVVTFIGGNGISTTASNTDNLTINYDGNLNNNSDVNIVAPAAGQILYFDGTDWINDSLCNRLATVSIDCLSDVLMTAPANGAMMYFNGTNWINFAIGAANQVLTVVGGIPTWANNTDATTASNVNVGGVGVYDGTVGNDIQFKGINNGNAAISITDDAGNNEIDVAVVLSPNAGQTASIGTTGLGSIQRVDEFTDRTDGVTTLTLTQTPLAGALVFLYRDGVLQPQSEIVSVVGTTLTFATPASTPVNGVANSTDYTVIYWVAAT